MNLLNREISFDILNVRNAKSMGVNFLLPLIVAELVLGGSGRLITFGSVLSLRYILFAIALLYFALKCISQSFVVRNNIFYINVILFFFVFFVSFVIGILNGYSLENIFKTSQGYLYLLMYFPFSFLVNSKEKAIYILRIFINSTVILSAISLIIFVLFYSDNSFYGIISSTLNKYNYGYIAIRGGLPAVFMKTSPLMAVSLIVLVFRFINLKNERSIKIIIKIIILMFGLISTMSMGIWIATITGMIFTIILSKGKYKIIGLFLSIFLFLAIIIIFPDYINISLKNRLSINDSSFIIKYDQFFRLIDGWADNPIFGKGFGVEISFLTNLGRRTMINFELFWLQLLVNMGLIGFIVYLSIFAKSMYYTFLLNKNQREYDSVYLKSLIVGLVVLGIISSVNPFLNNPIGIGFLILVMVSINEYYFDYKNENIKRKSKL